MPIVSSSGKVLGPAPPSGTFGLKTLYDPGDAVAKVDIVFLHGLTGRWDETWTYTEDDLSVFWPKDLLSGDIGNARIFSFGYDADAVNLRHRVSNETISHHADSLLLKLERERRTNARRMRRIVFVAHSLGGLVVEKALCLSQHKAEPHLRRIAESSMGLIFFGTPHLGADLAAWAKAGAGLASLLKRNNSKIIEVLEPSSEMLADIRDGMGELFRIRYERRDSLLIACFWEALPVTGVGEIVSRQSAIWPGHYKTAIHADHMNMTKFASTEDEGYKDFLGELQRWLEERDLSAIAPDQSLKNPQSIYPNTRDQQDVARAIKAPVKQDYHGWDDTSPRPPDPPYDEFVFRSSSTYGSVQDARQGKDRALGSIDHKDELVAFRPTDGSKIEPNPIFRLTIILRNSGPWVWPAGFNISHPGVLEVARSKGGEVEVDEEIGISFFTIAIQNVGPPNFDISLHINNISFIPRFQDLSSITEGVHERLFYPTPEIHVTATHVSFRVDSTVREDAHLCISRAAYHHCFVSEGFVDRTLEKAANIHVPGRYGLKNIECGGRVYRSIGTIKLQWRLPELGMIEHSNDFFVIPGNPFFEVVFGEAFFNSVTGDPARFREWLISNAYLLL
ncbi:hypothetical protein MMC27_003613 [Xylographa pallens]|nr:hypothetical protein [Xylographa pallens]